jgi:hypothetical protein
VSIPRAGAENSIEFFGKPDRVSIRASVITANSIVQTAHRLDGRAVASVQGADRCLYSVERTNHLLAARSWRATHPSRVRRASAESAAVGAGRPVGRGLRLRFPLRRRWRASRVLESLRELRYRHLGPGNRRSCVQTDTHPTRPEISSAGSSFVTSLVIEYDRSTKAPPDNG